jgi:peptidoglycan hydrolase FlgJ
MIASLQASSLSAAVGTASSPEELKHHKLTDAAQQFEGMFLQQMLKPMSATNKDDGSDEDDGDDKSEDSSSYSTLGVEAMAKAISAAGGLGIARNIVSSVEKERTADLRRQKKSDSPKVL